MHQRDRSDALAFVVVTLVFVILLGVLLSIGAGIELPLLGGH